MMRREHLGEATPSVSGAFLSEAIRFSSRLSRNTPARRCSNPARPYMVHSMVLMRLI